MMLGCVGWEWIGLVGDSCFGGLSIYLFGIFLSVFCVVLFCTLESL